MEHSGNMEHRCLEKSMHKNQFQPFWYINLLGQNGTVGQNGMGQNDNIPFYPQKFFFPQ